MLLSLVVNISANMAGNGCDCTSAIVAPPGGVTPVEASPTAIPRSVSIERNTAAAPSAGSFAATCGVCHESFASNASIGPA